ncbi:MAG TPA: OmpA family protein [Bryobacteraceae bacterium]|nr:OmpA family protein [Bryobacteraceae bacterium]
MKPRYLQTETASRDRWTISYLDMMTILLIFFVAVAAKTQFAATPPPPPPPPPPKPAVVEPEKPATNLLEIQEKLKGLHPHLDSRGLVISLPQAILFAPGDDRISRNAFPTVEKIAAVLGEIPNQAILVGYADSVPIHNRRFKNNWELSAARGLRLLELLTDRYGIEESRLSVSSDGSNHPRDSNETADGRASNRRVEIVIEDMGPVAGSLQPATDPQNTRIVTPSPSQTRP